MFKSWKAVTVAVAALLVLASLAEAARRLPNIDGVLMAGHDGTAQQIAQIDDNGNVSVEFGANAAAFTVGGPAADDAAASGNPVPVGGIYNTTLPTYTNLDRTQMQYGARGSLHVTLCGEGQTACGLATSAQADGVSNSTASAYVTAIGQIFNGSTWDRTRGNTDITVLASAARTATTASSDLTNYNARGIHVVIDVTASADTPSVTCTIQGKDALSGQYYTLLASAAITGTSTNVYRVFPGSTVTANAAANDIVPRTWRVNCVHADTDSITYSIGASVIL